MDTFYINFVLFSYPEQNFFIKYFVHAKVLAIIFYLSHSHEFKYDVWIYKTKLK